MTQHQPGQPEVPQQPTSTGHARNWVEAADLLGDRNPGSWVDRCKICGGTTRVTHQGLILAKYAVAYHLCTVCEYWCTDEPFWLDEAYGQAIAATDTGLVQRNIAVARVLYSALPRLFPTGPYVDWAGGHGLLVRLLRDAGFEFYWQDRYCENLMARGFDWANNRNGRDATVVTAVEVLEHTPDPLSFFHECMAGSGAEAVLFTQVLHAGGDDPNWWYLAPVTGQHVSFFSAETLARIADKLDMHIQSAGGFHVLSRSPIRPGRLRWAVRVSRLRSRAWVPRGTNSLVWADHLAMTERLTTARD